MLLATIKYFSFHALRFLVYSAKSFLCLVIWWPIIAIVFFYLNDYRFPNGAILDRNIDWGAFLYGDVLLPSRADLSLPDGNRIARNVDRLCWNETAVSGLGERRAFVWLGGSHEVVYSDDPAYPAAIATSGLGSKGPCLGFYPLRYDGQLLLHRYIPMRPSNCREWPDPW